ncbi:hypothetical protein [Streptomyces cavernae]|uniref:hypothetical protein n=1 Tax=Streptomyces cavernae TaxID=2259034 RepID=UPI0012D9983A
MSASRCPAEAIYYDLELPTEWKPYLAANADFFADLGSQGGAADLSRTDIDPDS